MDARREPRPALERRIAAEGLIVDISTRFVRCSREDIDNEIDNALALAAEFASADRSYVFLSSDNGAAVDNTHEWCAPGVERQIENLQGLSTEDIPWWMDRLHRFESISIPRVASLPPEAAREKEILEAQQIQSLLVVPMVHGSSLVGFLGFDWVRAESRWTDADARLLQVVANVFTNALERVRAEDSRRETERRNAALLSAIPDLIFRVSSAGVLLDYEPAESIELYAPPADFLGIHIAAVLPAAVAQQGIECLGRALSTGETASFEYELAVSDGPHYYEARCTPVHDDEALIIVRDVTDRRWEEAGEAAVRAISHLSINTKSLEALYDAVPRVLTQHLGFGRAAVELVDEDAGEMVFVGADGFATEDGVPLRVPIDQLVAGTVVRTGEAVSTSDADARLDNRFPTLRNLATKALLCVPMKSGDRVLGVLAVGDRHEREIPESLHHSVQVIANHLAQIIERTAAEAEVRALNVELEDRVTQRTSALNRANSELERELADRQRAEQALQQNQERYQLATTAALAGIWDWDLDTNDIYVDPQLKAILGFSDAEIPNRLDDWGARVHPEDVSDVMAVAEAHLDGETAYYEIEHRMVHRDGSIRWFLARGQAVRDEAGRPVRVLGTDTDVTGRKQAEAQIEQLDAELREVQRQRANLLRRILSTQEEERARISGELHNQVGQELTSLLVGLRSMADAQSIQDAKGQIADLRETTTRTLEQVRTLAFEMHTELVEDVGLADALERNVARLTERAPVAVDYHMADLGGQDISHGSMVAVYRGVQEAVTNVIRHADAKNLSVVVRVRGENILAIVEDNGSGFDVDAVLSGPIEQRFGLLTMREQVRLLGGEVRFESHSGEGTTVFVEVPTCPPVEESSGA